jgi:hypothetical protein
LAKATLVQGPQVRWMEGRGAKALVLFYLSKNRKAQAKDKQAKAMEVILLQLNLKKPISKIIDIREEGTFARGLVLLK